MSYQDGNTLYELMSSCNKAYIGDNPPKDYKPEKQKKLTDMFSNAALRENTFLKYLLLYMIINTSVMIVPIMRVRTVFILILVTRIPTVKLKIPGKSRIQKFCYIQVIVLGLSFLPVTAVGT